MLQIYSQPGRVVVTANGAQINSIKGTVTINALGPDLNYQGRATIDFVPDSASLASAGKWTWTNKTGAVATVAATIRSGGVVVGDYHPRPGTTWDVAAGNTFTLYFDTVGP